MPTSSAPRSRRDRPAKAPLSRTAIVAAAMRILETEDLDRLTMRRLAAELDTGPASLYVYVRDTADLHAYLLDELLGRLDLQDNSDAAWDLRLGTLMRAYTALLIEHPGLARSALVSRPSGPHYLDLCERIVTLLAEGGVPDDRAAWGLDLILLVATASAVEHGTRSRRPDVEEQDEAALAEALLRLDAGRHPRLAALGADLLSGSGDERQEWGAAVVAAGVRVVPLPRTASA